MASTRRLAAILAADVAGYSRLMEADEEGTHERLKTHRRQLIDPNHRAPRPHRQDHRRCAPSCAKALQASSSTKSI
jgi:hypothetical protein